MEVHVTEPLPNFHPSHHVHFVAIGQGQEWLRKETDCYPQNESFYPLNYENLPSPRSHVSEHSHGTEMSYSLSIQRSLSTCFFLRHACHQFSNHIPSKSLTIHPCYWLQPISQHGLVLLAISPSYEQPCVLLKVLPASSLSFREIPERGCSAGRSIFRQCLGEKVEPSVNEARVFFSSVSWS